jgi:hypothetical protein
VGSTLRHCPYEHPERYVQHPSCLTQHLLMPGLPLACPKACHPSRREPVPPADTATCERKFLRLLCPWLALLAQHRSQPSCSPSPDTTLDCCCIGCCIIAEKKNKPNAASQRTQLVPCKHYTRGTLNPTDQSNPSDHCSLDKNNPDGMAQHQDAWWMILAAHKSGHKSHDLKGQSIRNVQDKHGHSADTHVQVRQGSGSKMLHRVIKGSMHAHVAIFGQGTVNTTACHTVVGLKTEQLIAGHGVERLHRLSLQHRQALQQFQA